MSAREVAYLLIGGGVAAAHCALELRDAGAEGDVLLVSREPTPPYERPALSKSYLRGRSERADALVRDSDVYRESGVELRTGASVTALDAGERSARLQGGEEIRFERALLATGANVRILRLPGAELDGIHYLRAFGNADAIRADAVDADRVIVVGGSYLGCEVAASLRAEGKQCAIVMQEPLAFSTSLGPSVGRSFHELLIERGIEIHGGQEIEGFRGAGRVEAVVTASGETIEGDMVVVGAGVVPDTMLARRAGLLVDDGIVCSSALETSAPGIFAAGDVCVYDSVRHGRRVRVEHLDVAITQGRHAARAMLGQKHPYAELPYFFSELADWVDFEAIGPLGEWDEVVFRGDPGSRRWSAWYLRGGRLQGVVAINDGNALDSARGLLRERTDLTRQKRHIADLDSSLAAMRADLEHQP